MPLRKDYRVDKYPYHGAFYTYETDMDAPLDERETKEVLIEKVRCDIQRQGARHHSTLLGAGYTVYYPLEENPDWDGVDMSDKFLPIKVRRGMIFKGGEPLYPVMGTVEFVRFSQLGQASIDLKVLTETDV